MGDSTTEEVYPLSRDSAETKRLNYQHRLFFTYCDENLIHPSVPKDSLDTIADIGTGTGIWLEDSSKSLASAPTKSGNERSYDGFDISNGMFPSVPQKGMSFRVQDMFKPFPAELHGRYDLVHLRFVVGAIKEDMYKVVVENLLPLLKPGGYIQWDDVRWGCEFFNVAPDPKDAEQALRDLKSTDEAIYEFFRRSNISCKLPDLVEEYFKEIGLHIITKHEYPLADSEEKIAAARKFRMETTGAMPAVILRMGKVKTEEEAKSLVERDIKIFEKYFAQGWYSSVPLVTVVARKA